METWDNESYFTKALYGNNVQRIGGLPCIRIDPYLNMLVECMCGTWPIMKIGHLGDF